VFLRLVSSPTTFQCIMELDKAIYFVFISIIYYRDGLDLVLDVI